MLFREITPRSQKPTHNTTVHTPSSRRRRRASLFETDIAAAHPSPTRRYFFGHTSKESCRLLHTTTLTSHHGRLQSIYCLNQYGRGTHWGYRPEQQSTLKTTVTTTELTPPALLYHVSSSVKTKHVCHKTAHKPASSCSTGTTVNKKSLSSSVESKH